MAILYIKICQNGDISSFCLKKMQLNATIFTKHKTFIHILRGGLKVRLSEFSRFMWSDSSAKDKKFINLIQIGWNNCPPDSTYSHFKNMYIIHIIKSGSCGVELDGHRYTLGANEAFLVRPNELTIQTVNKESPCEMYYFAFNGDFTESLLTKTAFRDGRFYCTVDDNTIFEQIKNIAIELDGNIDYELITFEYLFKMLSFFDKNKIEGVPSKANSDAAHQKHISKVKEYIQQNYTREIKISEFAAQLGLSRSHLFRIFKTQTGKSIEEYVVSVRINTARSLLADTDLSCSAIAMSVGYAHYTTFFKMFKAYTGYTPQQYRAKTKNEITVKN